jgi:sterol desaturase/sphingolipid hydroxylase (fatty acid hydroxylase superfamily)
VILYGVILVLTFIFFTLLGYVVHRMFHQSWAGVFYRAHSNHHNQQYPPGDLVSDVYRDAGTDNTTLWMLAVFSPLILGNIVLTVAGIIPTFVGVGILVEMGVVSWLNESIHNSVHLTKSFWHRLWFFARLRRLHDQHHIDQGSNYGIFSFVWDKVFGTFRE